MFMMKISGSKASRLAPIFLTLTLGLHICVNAEPRLLQATPDSQRLFIENNNLSAEEFLAAYMGKDLMQRRYAEMYLLGVLDATEGHAWCSYQQFKTITLAETLYSNLEKTNAKQRKKRAAIVITEILEGQFPCKKERK